MSTDDPVEARRDLGEAVARHAEARIRDADDFADDRVVIELKIPIGTLDQIREGALHDVRYVGTDPAEFVPEPVYFGTFGGNEFRYQPQAPTAWERIIADQAYRDAQEAMERYRVHLRARLETLREPLTAAVQERLRGYFGECQRDDRRPLTWDSASHAVAAVIETLTEEAI